MRLGVTSDLHYDPSGHLTSREQLEALAGTLAAERLDALVLAGDLAVSLASFEECVSMFRGVGVPLGVLAGNHDVWRDRAAELSSERLFTVELPAATERAGAIWLEQRSMEIGGVAIVGSMAWYDYSAVDPEVSATPELLASTKRMFNNDAHRIDWERDDPGFAGELSAGLLGRLAQAAAGVSAVVVVTHVPVLEQQMVRKPRDPEWGFSNAYFGNLTLGHALLREPKLRALVSGHTHLGRDRQVLREGAPPVRAAVVGSDYAAPAYIVVEA
jgi:predicted MPP superfamily phosphohydrolase